MRPDEPRVGGGLGQRGRDPVFARRAGPARLIVAVGLLGLAGCAEVSNLPLVSDINLPKIPVPEALRIEETADKPANLVERGLSACDKRIETGETACLKKAVDDAHLTVPALVRLLPGCRLGQVCHYAYTTEDVVGLYSGTASHFQVHWRADFDFAHKPATVDAVPIKVVQTS